MKRLWEVARIPFLNNVSKTEWEKVLQTCWKTKDTKSNFYSTREVYSLRKVLDGLVIGQIDKNQGELSMVCPSLYNKARDGMYNESTGYSVVDVRKGSKLLGKQCKTANAYRKQVLNRASGERRGDAKDIMKMFEVIYNEKGWKKFAGFNRKCTLNTPYVLFKSKNITDPVVRASKWHKVRPIAPATKHPLKKLLGMAGRAWYFITKHAPDDNLILEKTDMILFSISK